MYAAERLGELVQQNKLNIKCIPTSFQSKQVCDHQVVESISALIFLIVDRQKQVNFNKSR